MRPPRALWVPFPLGRPLGGADEPAFQRRVLTDALQLLETANEPTIVDFPDEAPESAGPEIWACPLNLPPIDGDSYTQWLLSEVARMQPWAEETRRSRGGRTLIGASGGTADDIEAMARLLGAVADGHTVLELPDLARHVEWSHVMPYVCRHVADDLRVLYHEAIASQPGRVVPDHAALSTWIFTETVLGDVIQQLGRAYTATGDDRLTLLRGWTIPEGYVEGGEETFGRREPGAQGFEGAIESMRYLRGE
ncbi:MAG: hypothetical protein OEV40_27465 [Acidimicrobiia bacterium]|nr:hypothetical protein [Acidimicrobiia bacterium]